MNLKGPIFYSSNLQKSIDFFKKLGLTAIDIDEGRFAMLEFTNGQQLGIKQETGGREIPGSQTMMVQPNDISSAYKIVQKSGIQIVQELKTVEWGKTFIVEDPDGNWIEFIS
jgi:predicted enzyme related to lactoylglutathione lyase